jgi:hypothetical protein
MSTDPSKPSFVAQSNGIIIFFKTQPSSQSTKTTHHSVSTPTMVHDSIHSNSSPTKVSEVNVVKDSSPPQSGGKKKSKNKSNKNNNQTETQKHKHNHLFLKRNNNKN